MHKLSELIIFLALLAVMETLAFGQDIRILYIINHINNIKSVYLVKLQNNRQNILAVLIYDIYLKIKVTVDIITYIGYVM